MVNKKIISIIVAIAAIGAAAVTSVVIKRSSNTILNQNVEALMDKPVIGTGRICMLQDVLEWCIYLFPYEEYQGIFVSDPIVPEDEERD